MDKVTLRIVIFSFVALLIFNVLVGVFQNTSDPTRDANLNSLNLALIGAIGIAAGFLNRNKDKDE